MKFWIPLILSSVLLAACSHKAPPVEMSAYTALDKESRAETPRVRGDAVLNSVARFYAGISDEGVVLERSRQMQWREYADQMQALTASCMRTTDAVDSLMAKDMSDLREKCRFVFYPFSGPDFLYPISLFPDADTYFFVGLEPTGSPLSKIVADTAHFNSYARAFDIFLNNSFFRTKSMNTDLANESIDGTLPVISIQMAMKDYVILSVDFKIISPHGVILDAVGKSNLVEIRFCHPATPQHEQVLYYLAADLSDQGIDIGMELYMINELKDVTTVTFFKAASYLLHSSGFDKVRSIALTHSAAIISDDSGIPYRYVKDNYDVTLYGKYQRPMSFYARSGYQPDLEQLYDESSSVRPLPFRIGFNRISNLMVARRRK